MRQVVARLAAEDVVIERIVTSPLVRAVQTAEILAGLNGFSGSVAVAPDLAPEGDHAHALRSILAAAADEIVAWVGHEPSISELSRALVRDKRLSSFPRGGVFAALPRDHGPAAFEWMLVPSEPEIFRNLADLDR